MIAFQVGSSSGATQEATSEGHVVWLNQRKVRSFYRGVVAPELRSGVNMLLQVGDRFWFLWFFFFCFIV